MTFWECTALTASSGTRNSPAFSTYTTRPSGDTSRTAPNSSFPSATKVWYPTSIVSRMIGSPGSRDRPPSLLHEPRVQVNLRSGQRLRHGTVLLGVQRIPLKCRVVDARNLGLGLQLDPGDGEPFADLLELHLRARVDARRRQPRARKVRGQRHREAPGVSGADQLLRVGGGLAFLESGFERIRAVKGTAADSQPPAGFGQIPLPFCFCLSC